MNFTRIPIFILIFLNILLIYLYFRNMKTEANRRLIKNTIKKIDLYNKDKKDSPKLEYPIFYINMDKNNDRRDYMETQLSLVSDNYQRVPGFNGHKLSNTSGDTVDGVSFINQYAGLKKSEIGCCISHILSIRKAYESGTDIAMICEDDVYLGTYSLIPKLSEIVEDAPKDWKILQLFCFMNNNLKKKYKKREYVKRKYPNSIFTSTLAYLINRDGMMEILQKVYRDTDTIHIAPSDVLKRKYPPRGQSDYFIYDLIEECYATVPVLFFPDNTEMESVIHQDHIHYHISHSVYDVMLFDNLLSSKL